MRVLKRDVFASIDLAVRGRLPAAALNSNRSFRTLVSRRFYKRINYWSHILSNVTAASNEGAVRNFTLWKDEIGVNMAVNLKDSDLLSDPAGSLKHILTEDKKTFRHPYEAAMIFHYRLARVFEEIIGFENLIDGADFCEHQIQTSWPMTFRVTYGNEENVPVIDDDNDGMPYSVPVENKLDRWFFIASDVMYHSLGGDEYLTPFELTPTLDSREYAKALRHMNEAINCGLAAITFAKSSINVITVYKCRFAVNESLQTLFHCDDGPAMKFPEGKEFYFIDGLPTNRRLVLGEEITLEDIFEEEDSFTRSELIVKFGFERFIRSAKGEVIDRRVDSSGISELIRVILRETEYSSDHVYCAKVICPSTGKEYLLRVPPCNTLKEAVAWTFGIPADQYDPIAET